MEDHFIINNKYIQCFSGKEKDGGEGGGVGRKGESFSSYNILV